MCTIKHKKSYTLHLAGLSVLLWSVGASTGIADEAAKTENVKVIADKEMSAAGVGSLAPEMPTQLAQVSRQSPIDLATLTMTVYKSSTCGCCKGWVEYMKEEGFVVESVDTDNMNAVKMQLGLHSPKLHSCHTAVIDGYVVEGHVPADDVKRLLSERPEILALTAPGMPMMSPGMASRTPKDYDVLSLDKAGDVRLWSAY